MFRFEHWTTGRRAGSCTACVVYSEGGHPEKQSARMIRGLLTLLLVLHGVAHLVGFVVPWKFISARDMPYRTTILGGRVDIGDAGIRILGLIWLALALATIGLGLALLMDRLSYSAALGVLTVSLLCCAIGWPDARIGVFMNLFLITAFIVRRHVEWMG